MFEVYQCQITNSLRNLLKAKTDKMFVQIDDQSGEVKISGRGYIANEDGKNEYINDFSYFAKDITGVQKGEFQAKESLIFDVKIKSIYGNKKAKIILPNLGNLNKALDTITNFVKGV